VNPKRIKIFSIATTYPESNNSKKPKFVHLLNKELVKLGVNVKAITPHSKGAMINEIIDSVDVTRFRYLPENKEFDSLSIPDEINKSKIAYFKVFMMVFGFFVSVFFNCIKEKPDIIHGQWAFPGGYIAYVIARVFHKKSITTVHFAEIPLLKKFPFIKKIVINSLNKSTKVVTVSNFTKNALLKLGVRDEKITVIKPVPNFLPSIKDTMVLEKFKQKFTDSNYKIIFFVGRLVERKGVEYLIKSIPSVKSKNIHVVISGEGHLLEKLKTLTKSFGLEKKITFFEGPTDEELGLLFGISDVFVCPSIIDSKGETEGLGLVIVEAMKFNLPVIAGSVGGILELIKNGENGILVPQKDSDSIASAIDKILQDEELRLSLIENSKKTVQSFLPSSIGQEYLALYKETLNFEV